MKRTTATAAVAGLALSSALTLLAPARPAGAGVPFAITGRASVLPGGSEPATTGDSTDAAVSGNGRYIVFSSTARLVAADTDNVKDVYLKDLLTDSVERINVTTNGAAATSSSTAGAITPDGRYVAFWSWATNLVPGDTGAKTDVFVRDRQTGTTERVSVSSSEQQGNGNSPNIQNDSIDLSSDGRYVTFSSTATNLGADADTLDDVFVRDRQAGTTELVSVTDAEASVNGSSFNPTMSADGRYVAFESEATDLVPSDTNGSRDVFVRDRQAGTVQRVSVHDNESQSPTASFDAQIDDGGAKVVFTTNAKLNAIDPNSSNDVYVRTRTANTTTVASVGTDGWAAGQSAQGAIRGDGTTVAYQSTSPTALAGANGWDHIYTRWNTTTTRLTVTTGGTVVSGTSSHPSLSANGRVAAFASKSGALVTNDTGKDDIFFRRFVDFGPYGEPASFVQRQVPDFTGSESPALSTSLTAAVRNGASPEHAVAALASAPAFAGKRPPVIRLYAAYFGRLPDQGGLAYWVGKLTGGAKLDSVSAKFAASNEFKTKYGNTTNSAFVKLVYQNVMNRQPDAGGLAYWVAKLDAGLSRGSVMTAFSESSEGQRKFRPQVTATLLGLGMLHKIPSGALLTSLTTAGADSPEAQVRVLLDSAEYAATVDL